MSYRIVCSKHIFSGNDSVITAFVIKNSEIIAVGRKEQMVKDFPNAEIIDFKNKLIVPGFNDHHIHIWKVGNLLTFMLDLRGVVSKEEMLKRIEDFSIKNPNNRWVLARGFNEINFPDGQIPTAKDLDSLRINKPVFVVRSCAHIGIANSIAMNICGIFKHTQTPVGGEIRKDEQGNPNGIFCETALGLIQSRIPPYSKDQYKQMILAAQKALLRFGITAATDPAVHPELLEVYREMEKEGSLKIRINAIAIRIPDGGQSTYPLPERFNSEFLTIDSVKFFSDGGLSGKTAALSFPYKNSKSKGILRLDYKTFYGLAKESYEAGFRIATHAIGDVAVNLTLDVYEAIQKDKPFNHRIEHLGFVSEKNFERMKKLGTVAVMQPIFFRELGENFKAGLEDEYWGIVYPFRSVFKNKIPMYFSTDAPVVKELNPLAGLKSAMERRLESGEVLGERETISLKAALKCYTQDLKNEEPILKKGEISPGFVADFVVFTQDFLTDENFLYTTQVDSVFVHGIEQNIN